MFLLFIIGIKMIFHRFFPYPIGLFGFFLFYRDVDSNRQIRSNCLVLTPGILDHGECVITYYPEEQLGQVAYGDVYGGRREEVSQDPLLQLYHPFSKLLRNMIQI